MGQIGLTEKQLAKMNELKERKLDGKKPLTALMEIELSSLEFEHANPKLPQTAITYLRDWYSDDREPIFNKYLDKGNYVESDLIDFMAEQLGLGLAQKNQETKSDEYMIGTCDVDSPQQVIDVKAPWNNRTLQENIDGIDPEYEWQLRGYMRLWNKEKAILFYGLMDTPAEVNFEREVSYSDIPASERWIAYQINRDKSLELAIISRVMMCRSWLTNYHLEVQSKLGKTHLT